ncbi:uncharacterized protein LOC129607001 [Condylostylus longicornis]|uniref:uncharacterized protein LOC129607001 n=1 Tax=Condylostylus longicornis TaxID=2530218 RepID=UPI00244DFE43|nr:uncharacterized protein LOC129607001 [Condylostylus longicornis]
MENVDNRRVVYIADSWESKRRHLGLRALIARPNFYRVSIFKSNPAARKKKIIKIRSTKGVQFHFIQHRSPYFEVLWDTALKSANLLQHTLTSLLLTSEELSTFVAEDEAIFNSRPLTPLSSSPSDYAALNPWNFLVEESSLSVLSPQNLQKKVTQLSRLKLVTNAL